MNSLQPHTSAIFPEMMAHPAIFTHPHPQKISIIGDEDNLILQEVLKHTLISEIWHTHAKTMDARILSHKKPTPPNSLDIIIHCNKFNQQIEKYFHLLNQDGILVQPCESIFHLTELKLVFEQLKTAGFSDMHILNFPDSHGWQTAIMALKQGIFKKIREPQIFNKSFKTYYYNFDVHKAAMVLPEFIREHNIFNE